MRLASNVPKGIKTKAPLQRFPKTQRETAPMEAPRLIMSTDFIIPTLPLFPNLTASTIEKLSHGESLSFTKLDKGLPALIL